MFGNFLKLSLNSSCGDFGRMGSRCRRQRDFLDGVDPQGVVLNISFVPAILDNHSVSTLREVLSVNVVEGGTITGF